MERVSGYLNETPKMRPGDKDTVMSIAKGDAVMLRGVCFQVAGFFRNEAGDRVMRLSRPDDYPMFRVWCWKNPHKVKRIEAGYLLNS